MEANQARYLDDFTSISKKYAVDVVASPDSLTIALPSEYPIGFVWFTDHLAALHKQAHILFEARYYRQVKAILPDIIDRAFADSDTLKLKAMAMHSQKSAVRILESLKFKSCGLLRNETTVKSKKTDVLLYELHRRFWQRYRKLTTPKPVTLIEDQA
jgi:RimJ/RimL family protein N-acetyltransferase